jgi:excisionase family DNA binding protein
VISGAAVTSASPLDADAFQAACVEGFVASWAARGFSPVGRREAPSAIVQRGRSRVFETRRRNVPGVSVRTKRTDPLAPLEPANPRPGPLLLTIPEAAALLRVGRSTAYEFVGRGELEVVHIGRAVRVPVAALVERLRSNSR